MSGSDFPETWFASAERSAAEVLARQHGHFNDSLASALLDALPDPCALLNSHRQVVHANRAFLRLTGREHPEEIVGLRPGEVLQCIHVDSGPNGCGTSPSCGSCGAVINILKGQDGGHGDALCQLHCHTSDGRGVYDFRVVTDSFDHAGERFVLFRLENVTAERRRQELERLFFHDVLNLVGAIRGFTELLNDYPLQDRDALHELLLQASHQLVDQVHGQRLLLKAEQGDLKLKPQPVDVLPFLKDLVAVYRHHPAVQPVRVSVSPANPEAVISTDTALLSRIMGNLLLNACEAVGPGGHVAVGCDAEDAGVRIWVENEGEIPAHVQEKIFACTVSSKGRGRGLGTYSVRLFCDYLGGQVSFSSRNGLTRFWVSLPKGDGPHRA